MNSNSTIKTGNSSPAIGRNSLKTFSNILKDVDSNLNSTIVNFKRMTSLNSTHV